LGDGRCQLQRAIEVELEFGGVNPQGLHGLASVNLVNASSVRLASPMRFQRADSTNALSARYFHQSAFSAPAFINALSARLPL
jgi:hypothetical protein